MFESRFTKPGFTRRQGLLICKLLHYFKIKMWIICLCSRFNHGSCAERCRPLLLHPVCVPCIVARGWGSAADPEPAGGDQPRGCGPLPGPGGPQLPLHLWPQADETPAVLRGTNHVCYLMTGVGNRVNSVQLIELCPFSGCITLNAYYNTTYYLFTVTPCSGALFISSLQQWKFSRMVTYLYTAKQMYLF